MKHHTKRKAGKHRTPEGKKISKLVRGEGKDPKQAVAIALNMKRAHRLTPSGGYRRVKRSKRRQRKS